MRLQALTAVFALVALAFCDPAAEMLDARSPINVVPGEPSPSSPYFLVTGFEAFISSRAYPTMHSRAAFNLTLMHPDMAQRWSTLCKTHTASDLCDTSDFLPCEPVAGAANADERLSFRLSANIDSVEIMRLWTYKDMHLKTMASEGTYWDESVNGGNVTVSQYGKLYQRPAGWVFAWRQTVG